MKPHFALSTTLMGTLLTITTFLLTLVSATTSSSLSSSIAQQPYWIKRQLSSFSASNFIHFANQETSVALTSENVLVSLDRFGSVEWRLPLLGLDSNESQWIVDIQSDSEQFLVVQNLNNGKSLIQLASIYSSIVDDVLQLESSVSSVSYRDGLVLLTLKNGDVLDFKLDDLDNIVRYNLYFLKGKSHDELNVELLENGNVLFFFKNDDGKVGYIHYDKINKDTEGIHPFNFEELDVEFTSTVEVIGSKLAYTKDLKTYVVKIDESNGEIANQFTLPTDTKYVPVNTADFIVFEKNHNLEFHSSRDLSLLFTIDNVLHYDLTYITSLELFFLVTEYHIRVIDAQEGLELKSFFVGPEPLPFDVISKVSVTANTGISSSPYTLIQYKNHTTSFYHEQNQRWSHDPTLAEVTAYTVIDVNAEAHLTKEEVLYEEDLDLIHAYIYRVTKHAKELYAVYNAAWEWLPKYFGGEYAPEEEENSHRAMDLQFGFVKRLILGSRSGVVTAVDSSNGITLWTFNTDSVDSIVSLQDIEYDGLYVLVFTAEGKVFKLRSVDGKLIESFQIAGPIDTVKRLDAEGTAFLLELTTGFDVIYTVDEQEPFLPIEDLYFLKSTPEEVKSFVISKQDSSISRTWSFKTHTSSEKIIKVSQRSPKEQSAQIGVVLGDKSVLYKYLNPHLISLVTYDSNKSTLYIHLIDSVTGEFLYSAYHENVSPEGLDVVVGEHYIVYSYYNVVDGTPAQKIGVLDLYESSTPNTRITRHSSSASNTTVSSFQSQAYPEVLSKSYIIPSQIKSLSLSRTKFGVTTRAILVTFTSGQTLSIPKPILDARRPTRDLTSEEKTEGTLRPYDALIPIDDLSVIAKSEHVISGAEGKVVSLATDLESTSLVCQFGAGDLTCGKVTPSGEFDSLNSSFQRGSLILTLTALAVGSYLLNWFAGAKRVKGAWVKE